MGEFDHNILNLLNDTAHVDVLPRSCIMRLDKLLANKAYGSRKEVHQLIKDRRVTINGSITTKKIPILILMLI